MSVDTSFLPEMVCMRRLILPLQTIPLRIELVS